jgi:hypothetical protein
MTEKQNGDNWNSPAGRSKGEVSMIGKRTVNLCVGFLKILARPTGLARFEGSMRAKSERPHFYFW